MHKKQDCRRYRELLDVRLIPNNLAHCPAPINILQSHFLRNSPFHVSRIVLTFLDLSCVSFCLVCVLPCIVYCLVLFCVLPCILYCLVCCIVLSREFSCLVFYLVCVLYCLMYFLVMSCVLSCLVL